MHKILIMANTMMERKKTWGELRKIFGFTPKLDGLLSTLRNTIILDTMELDDALAQHDPEYDNMEGKYKGITVSMHDYILMKYGAEVLEKVKELM